MEEITGVTFYSKKEINNLKKKLRIELLSLINLYPEYLNCNTLEETKALYPEWDKKTSLNEEIQKISRLLEGKNIDKANPIKLIDERNFSYQSYFNLKILGYTDESIAQAMGKNEWQFKNYKQIKGL